MRSVLLDYKLEMHSSIHSNGVECHSFYVQREQCFPYPEDTLRLSSATLAEIDFRRNFLMRSPNSNFIYLHAVSKVFAGLTGIIIP